MAILIAMKIETISNSKCILVWLGRIGLYKSVKKVGKIKKLEQTTLKTKIYIVKRKVVLGIKGFIGSPMINK